MTFTFRKRTATRDVILHDLHTCDPLKAPAAWLTVEGRKLGLLHPGYHLVVLRDGSHLQMRPLDAVGNHTMGFNKFSIGIALEGGRRVTPGPDGEHILVPADNFTQEQRDALKFLYREVIVPVYGELPIKAHSECGAHSFQLKYPCPALDMDKLRASL